MENLESIMRQHEFLNSMPESLFPILSGCASNALFGKDEFVFHEGEEAKKVYLIRTGEVAIEMYVPGRGYVSIEKVGKGEVLGWSWLVPPYHWHFNARAIETVRAIELDGECLRKKCEEDHDLGFHLLKRFSHVMSQRLQASRLQLMDVYGTKQDW